MQSLKTLGLLLIAGVLAVVAVIIYQNVPRVSVVPPPMITTFEECVAAGNPVMESHPRRCMTPDQRYFVDGMQPVIDDPNAGTGEGMASNGCAVAGCSQQLCVSADEAPTIITTCEYRAEYICYREASCEPQANGRCGWTPSAELQQCLANPPGGEFEGELEVM